MITWKETLKRLDEDSKRLRDLYDKDHLPRRGRMIFHNSFQCCLLFRLAHYFYQKKWRLFARTFWYLNLFLTGANINPGADVGGGVFMNIPLGVTLYGKIGRNCTFIGVSAVMKSRSYQDIGAGPGMPLVGDNVTLGYGTTILGPVRIGNNSTLGSHCCIKTDLPENSIIELEESIKRVSRKKSPDSEPEPGQ